MRWHIDNSNQHGVRYSEHRELFALPNGKSAVSCTAAQSGAPASHQDSLKSFRQLSESKKPQRLTGAKCLNLNGGQSRNRTTDTRIFNGTSACRLHTKSLIIKQPAACVRRETQSDATAPQQDFQKSLRKSCCRIIPPSRVFPSPGSSNRGAAVSVRGVPILDSETPFGIRHARQTIPCAPVQGRPLRVARHFETYHREHGARRHLSAAGASRQMRVLERSGRPQLAAAPVRRSGGMARLNSRIRRKGTNPRTPTRCDAVRRSRDAEGSTSPPAMFRLSE